MWMKRANGDAVGGTFLMCLQGKVDETEIEAGKSENHHASSARRLCTRVEKKQKCRRLQYDDGLPSLLVFKYVQDTCLPT